MKQLSGLFSDPDIFKDPGFNKFTSDNITVWIYGSLFLQDPVDNPCNNPAEYLAHQFVESGNACFKKLDGTFLVIIRTEGKSLFYRDRFGSGMQLYYNKTGYSNTPSGLLKITNTAPEPDLNSLSGFLQFGYIPSPVTGLKNIHKLPGGVVGTWNGNTMELNPVYTWQDFYLREKHDRINRNEAIELYKNLHLKAIKKRIAGAGSVGVLLSGGYDSAGNIAGLREVYNGKVEAFSIGFKDNPWSEVPQARLMAEKIGAEFNSYEIDGDEINNLPELLKQLGDPFQEGGVMVNFAAMRLAAGFRPDVILGGDGNDQYHGTSAKELAFHYLLRKTGLILMQRAFWAYERRKSSIQDNQMFRYSFHNRKILNILTMDAFGFSQGELSAMGLQSQGQIRYGVPSGIPSFRSFEELFFHRQFFVDVKQVINEVILFKAGQNAALQDLSIAFPYMDKDLTDFLDGLPRDFRFAGSFTDLLKGRGTSKFLHRKSYSSAMPPELSSKKKQGGFAPLPIFFKSDANLDLIEKVVLQSGIKDMGLNMVWIKQFINRYRSERSGQPNWFWYTQLQAFRMFNLLVLSVWWEMVVNGRDVSTLDELISR